MVDNIQYYRMCRLVSLDDDLALLPFPSSASADLFHELETTLKRPEIREREHIVSIEDADGLHMVEVEAFGDHLGADEYVGLAVFKLVEYELI